MTTRTARKSAGRIAFVGAGPGDPGLLTRRAHDTLADADQVVYDRGVPESLLAAVRAEAKDDTQFSPAEGAPGDVAKVLLSAARSGTDESDTPCGLAGGAGGHSLPSLRMRSWPSPARPSEGAAECRSVQSLMPHCPGTRADGR